MRKLNGKTLWVVIAGIFMLGIISSAVWFLNSEINETSRVISEASISLAMLREKEREFEESSANLKKFSLEIANLNKAFLSEETFVDLLRLFEDLARAAGVKFKAQSAKVPTASDDKASLSFELEGEKESLVRFFILLDRIPYSGIADSINWSQQGKEPDNIKVNANYIIFNYVK